jgi:hypothetical protein
MFQAAIDRQERARVPFAELLGRQPWVLLLATLSFILAGQLADTTLAARVWAASVDLTGIDPGLGAG